MLAIINDTFLFTEVEIAIEAYIYTYPILVNVLLLFEYSVWPHTPGYFGMNTFTFSKKTIDWTTPGGSDPALEIMFSRAWLDLEKHPIVLNIPDIPEEVRAIIRQSK